MDKERARFVLRCFRPDGADVGDPDFAAALRTAAEDRELGEWLAQQRAHDAAFAAALAGVAIPDGLRDEILAGFAIERGDLPQAADPIDATFIGALASLCPPVGLRDQLVAAMERSVPRRPGPGRFWKFAVPLAAAAAVALALFLRPGANERPNRMPLAAVEAGFHRIFNDPSFHFDLANADHQAMYEHLKRQSLPCPCPRTLPPGLAGVAGLGCRVLEIDGHRGSLICFDERRAGTVHLIVFFRAEVADDPPAPRSPQFEQHGGWAVARWASHDRVFLLLGTTRTERLQALF